MLRGENLNTNTNHNNLWFLVAPELPVSTNHFVQDAVPVIDWAMSQFLELETYRIDLAVGPPP
jgi:hypothetical protein